MHVSDTVHMNEKPDAGYNQHHPDRQLIHQKSEIDLEVVDRKEIIQVNLNRAGGRHLIEASYAQQKRGEQHAGTDDANGRFGQVATKEAVDGKANQGQKGN